MLLVESAEGGAGVLRRLVDDESTLAKAARTALEIMHFDPISGNDLARERAASGEEPCVRACYDCLLSYGNQGMHESMNRHLVRDLMLRLSRSAMAPAGTASRSQAAAEDAHGQVPANPAAAEFVTWLAGRELRLPDQVDGETGGASPDLIYRLPDGNVAIFVESGEGTGPGRDDIARERLRDAGWSVITVGPTGQWPDIVARYPSVFGSR